MPVGTEARLKELSITLPPPPSPGGSYIPARTVGNIVFLSGVVSMDASGIITGMLGLDRTVEEGYAAARTCALTQLAVLRRHLGSLDAVKSVISVNGYVNAVAGFKDSPEVINGASNLFVEVFGDSGRHVRAAIGVSALPRYALVEVQMSVEI
jgi:enamine deaminase RidA (YjgF/YER057c/UK114 family)